MSNNSVDWVNVFNKIFLKLNSTVRVRSDDIVIVYNMDWYKMVPAILENTPKRVIANYFGWKLVNSLDQFVGTTNSKYQCSSLVASMLSFVGGRLYVETSFSKKDKNLVSFKSITLLNKYEL